MCGHTVSIFEVAARIAFIVDEVVRHIRVKFTSGGAHRARSPAKREVTRWIASYEQECELQAIEEANALALDMTQYNYWEEE